MTLGQLASDTLVVGTGAGGLLQCTLSTLRPLTRRPEYKDPVTLIYQAHQAVITAVRSGPTGKTFASASSDGQIRVYKSDEVGFKNPVPKINYKFQQKDARFVVNIRFCPLDIFWTESPSVFGVCGSENTITFVKATIGQVLDFEFKMEGNEPVTVTEAIKNRLNKNLQLKKIMTYLLQGNNCCGKFEW